MKDRDAYYLWLQVAYIRTDCVWKTASSRADVERKLRMSWPTFSEDEFEELQSTSPEDDLHRRLGSQVQRHAKLLRQVDHLREVLTSDGHTWAEGAVAWI